VVKTAKVQFFLPGTPPVQFLRAKMTTELTFIVSDKQHT